MTRKAHGRPRCPECRAAVLEAVHDMLRGHSLQSMTIEGIARRAGVGKQTIYRWWKGKADLVMEALGELACEAVRPPESGSLENDLATYLAQAFEAIEQWSAQHLRCLMVEAQLDEEFRRKFRERFLEKRRCSLKRLFEAARERGELPTDADADLAADMVFGMMWYRLLVGHAPLDERYAGDIARLVAKSFT